MQAKNRILERVEVTEQLLADWRTHQMTVRLPLPHHLIEHPLSTKLVQTPLAVNYLQAMELKSRSRR